jgi:hypothetical protein
MSWRRIVGELMLIGFSPAVVLEMTLGQVRTVLHTLAERRDDEARFQAALAGVRFD